MSQLGPTTEKILSSGPVSLTPSRQKASKSVTDDDQLPVEQGGHLHTPVPNYLGPYSPKDKAVL